MEISVVSSMRFPMPYRLFYRFVSGVVGFTTCLSLSLLPTAATADITLFTSQAAFENAITALTPLSTTFLNDFAGQPRGQSSYTASGNGFSYRASQSGANPEQTFRINDVLGTDASDRNLIFTATGGNYTAIGGNFFIGNAGGTFLSQALTVTVSNATETLTTPSYTPTSATVGSFRGFISTIPLTTLTVNNSTTGQYASSDNLRVGLAAASTAAPEPGSLALLLPVVGVAGMVIRKCRKN
ncbi:MAG: PEP-CTERM sorting domain-containing protein [Armatimonadota bacterium]